MLPTPFDALTRDLGGILPPERLITDPLRTLAYGTDASFYRLVPKLVVVVDSETDVMALLAACRRHGTPVTFRAAGTSLSGQAVTDSVLAVLGDGWGGVTVATDGALITLQPGVIGADANRRLASFGRRIGPDPASINAARIGGIAANNASGMCCGTAQNSYRTLESLRVILVDGTLLDTGDPGSRARFRASHGGLLDGLAALAASVHADPVLADRIHHKFKIKNTTGYGINALVDFDDPIDILQHLLIGSEGTLGFIAGITYRTVPDPADKASTLLLFPTIAAACAVVPGLQSLPVAAAELMDRAALRSVEHKPGIPEVVRGLGPEVAALLVETRAESPQALADNVATILAALSGVALLEVPTFTTDPQAIERLWTIRKGMLPSVGALRATGTTVIIEDVAFPIDRLADATTALATLLTEHGYRDAILFGHALAGNLHFVFTQDFGSPVAVQRYHRFMAALADLVVGGFDGSLKAEHGTGRNVAPFVEQEWGRDAYRLMREIKRLFDPEALLNPGVILNDDPDGHVKNLKPLPPAHELVDKCIECGFCEPVCPSHRLTLSPRQRIVGWREISRLAVVGDDRNRRDLERRYDYQGLDTCAACGLCATACPVGIETGLLIKLLRGRRQGAVEHRLADFAARHFGTVLAASRGGLAVAGLAQRLLGSEVLEGLSGGLRRLSGKRLPAWHRAMPGPVPAPVPPPAAPAGVEDLRPAVVYVPSCASRTLGPAADGPETIGLPERVEALLAKAGFRVIRPPGLERLCCGKPMESKGLTAEADAMAAEMIAAIRAAGGESLPVVVDTNPCTQRLKEQAGAGLQLVDIIAFLHDRVIGRLEVVDRRASVAVHVTCSARRMGLAGKLVALAQLCAEQVVVPDGIGCCGFAGDKGFTTPELNAHALRTLKSSLPATCDLGVSASRTCEIGLSQHAGIPYLSIVSLVDGCTVARGVG